MTAICITLVVLLIIGNFTFKCERKEKKYYKAEAIRLGMKVHNRPALTVERMLERRFMKGE